MRLGIHGSGFAGPRAGSLTVTPDPVQIATEGALWGSIQSHEFLREGVVVSKPALGPAKPDRGTPGSSPSVSMRCAGCTPRAVLALNPDRLLARRPPPSGARPLHAPDARESAIPFGHLPSPDDPRTQTCA